MRPQSQKLDQRAQIAIADADLQVALNRLGSGLIEKRQQAANAVEDFELMRDQAREVRQRSLRDIDIYIRKFEAEVKAAGGTVHWAESTDQLREIVIKICEDSGAAAITKGKSMVSEEAHLNQALEEAGITPWETDLGEYIIQLAQEPPSHIVVPSFHKSRAQIAELFNQAHDFGERDLSEVKAIVDEARHVIRERFINADVGITGANMLIAESGSAVLCTNEGNGDLTARLPKTHIITTSFDRVVPTHADAAKIIRVLARNATGQAITSYTSYFSANRKDDLEPQNFHVVLLDNNRSKILGSEFEEMLHCIRCGACMNHCPVFQSIGGHAYDSVYPGPMGAVLSPLLRGLPQDYELAQASTFCGRCEEVCPVRIPLPKLLRKLRDHEKDHEDKSDPWLSAFTWLARRPRLYRWVINTASHVGHKLSRGRGRFTWLPFVGAWTNQRDLSAPEGGSAQTQLRKGSSSKSNNRQTP